MPTKISRHLNILNVHDNTVFRDVSGALMDIVQWQDPLLQNNLIRMPSLGDIDTSSVPKHLFQSGTGDGLDLDLEEINFENKDILSGWYPGVTRGLYRIHNKSYYLHGADSIALVAGREIDADGFSIIDLPSMPEMSVPLSIAYLERDPETLGIDFGTQFSMVPRFTPRTEDGIEIGGSIDSTTNEFLLIRGILDSLTVDLEAVNPNVTNVNGIHPVRTAVTFNIPEAKLAPWANLTFDRPDIFKKRIDGSGNWLAAPLRATGDYTVTANELGVTIQIVIIAIDAAGNVFPDPPPAWGKFSYTELSDTSIQFNKNVAQEHQNVVLTTRADPGPQGVEYYLPVFPAFDDSRIELDTVSMTLEVSVDNGANFVAWTRVRDLLAGANDATAFEFDSFFGVIKFGKGTAEHKGRQPATTDIVRVSYTSIPLIRYDEIGARAIFDDRILDLDPMKNSMKQGFVVLDNQRPVPYQIILTSLSNHNDQCVYGPLNAPPVTPSDFSQIRAKVLARNGDPVPGIGVRFFSLDGQLTFSQRFGVTDAAGAVYSETYSVGQIEQMLSTVELWQARETAELTPQDPIDLAITDMQSANGVWNDVYPYEVYGEAIPNAHNVPAWTCNTIILDGIYGADPEDIYLFIASRPEIERNVSTDAHGREIVHRSVEFSGQQPMPHFTPYDSRRRVGGLASVWLSDHFEDVTDPSGDINPLYLVRPIEVRHQNGMTYLIFDRALPLPWRRQNNEANINFVPPLDSNTRIVQFRIMIDQIARIIARTTDEPLLESNELTYAITLNPHMRGQHRIIDPDQTNLEGRHGTRLSSATFLTPSQPIIYEIQDLAGVTIADFNQNQHLAYALNSPFSVRIFANASEHFNPGNLTGAFELPDATRSPGLKPSVFIVQVGESGSVIDKIVSVIRVPTDDVILQPTAAGQTHYIQVNLPTITAEQVQADTTPYLALGGFNLGDNRRTGDERPRSSIRINFS